MSVFCRLHWQSHLNSWQVDAGLEHWLTVAGSLTARLQALGSFAVQRLAQQQGRSLDDGLADHRRAIWQRAVVLKVDEQALVFAHSEWSTASKGPLAYQLRRLGNRPLGSLLFTRRGFTHGPLAFCRLKSTHPLAREAARQLGLASGAALWARRAEHRLGHERLVVIEVFSPLLAKRVLPVINSLS
jgi:chorismate--pyruvate lyase